jgi:CBS domain-containing protein
MMNPLMKLATPTLHVDIDATVDEAVNVMVDGGRGAVAVTEGKRLAGIFTERDLMQKVVKAGLSPVATPVREVMCAAPTCVQETADRSEALDIMLKQRFRHLPICDEQGEPVGMLSFRDLLSHQIGRLRNEVDSLEAYLCADGPGGD